MTALYTYKPEDDNIIPMHKEEHINGRMKLLLATDNEISFCVDKKVFELFKVRGIIATESIVGRCMELILSDYLADCLDLAIKNTILTSLEENCIAPITDREIEAVAMAVIMKHVPRTNTPVRSSAV